MPSFPELREPLTDGVVRVRFAAERDIPEVLIAYQDDPTLHLRLGRRLALTVVEPDDDTCRGQIYVYQVDWDHARADLAIWVAPQMRGRGLGARALGLVATWLLRTSGLQRVQLFTESDNEALIRTAERARFSYEGVLRGYTREAGRRLDNAVLSMVVRDLKG
jgi:RimJ/RimL family protein N-acetyltransferase